MSNEQTRITISDEEKALLVQDIIDSIRVFMERTISRKSPKSRARDSSKHHKQSKTHIARKTIIFNILTNTQRLPARPRDFRINLAEEERDILSSELSDILSSMIHQHFLQNKREKFPFSRGKPLSDIKKSGIADEPRGSESVYKLDVVKEAIDEILKDSKSRQTIDNAILKSETFFRFLRYSFEVGYIQLKENENAFLNTMRPPIQKYGLTYKGKPDSSDILVKYFTPDKIKRQAKGLAIVTVKKFQEDGKDILYTVATMFSLLNAYGLEKGGKESNVV